MGTRSETAIVRRGVKRLFDRFDGLLAGLLERRLGLRIGGHLLPLRAELSDHLLELRALVTRLVLHARLVLLEEGVAHFDADLVLRKRRRSAGNCKGTQHENTNALHVIRSARWSTVKSLTSIKNRQPTIVCTWSLSIQHPD